MAGRGEEHGLGSGRGQGLVARLRECSGLSAGLGDVDQRDDRPEESPRGVVHGSAVAAHGDRGAVGGGDHEHLVLYGTLHQDPADG